MRKSIYLTFGYLLLGAILLPVQANNITKKEQKNSVDKVVDKNKEKNNTTPSAAPAENSNSTITSSDPVLLPGMTIGAHQFGIPISKTGVSVTTLDPLSLQEEGIYSLTKSLDYVPGVYVSQDGGERGGISAIRLRGLNSSVYTMNVVDGIRLSDSNISPINYFGSENTFSLSSIEIIRGPQGAMYGGDAIGGIVRQTTPKGEGDPSFKIFGEGGSFGSGIGVGTAQGKIGKTSYYYSGGYETIQNDTRPFAEGQGNNFQNWFQSGSIYYAINSDNTIGFTSRYSNSSFESPSANYVTSSPKFILKHDDTESWLTTLQGQHHISDFWQADWNAGLFRQDLTSTSANSNYSSFESRSYKYQLNWYNMLTWSEKTQSIIGTTYDYTKYDSAGSSLSHNSNNTYAIFGEQLYQPWKWLDLSAAIRAERQTAWGNKITWRGGFSIHAIPEWTRIFGTIGTGYRTPSFNDLYANFGYYRGNPNLRPMNTLGGDLGVEQHITKNHTVTVTGFATELRDNITYKYAFPVSTMANEGIANVAGVESSLTGKFNDAWKTFYTIQYTYAWTRGTNNQPLPGSAKNVWSGQIQTNPTEKWMFGAGFIATAGREAINTSANLDNYFTTRLFTRYQLTDSITLHARIENLFDEKYDLQYDFDGALPARGFGIYGGATIEF